MFTKYFHTNAMNNVSTFYLDGGGGLSYPCKKVGLVLSKVVCPTFCVNRCATYWNMVEF